ncbi:MAG: zinc ribbon domain-containing protein, partial [Lachnospiraceae bacterium]|nr:zinc ribbon domain-containing protein [Lachnospiraceae bacterium]
MNCPQCGAPLNPGAKFCTSCGAKQQVEPVFAPAPEAAPAAPAYEAPTYEAPAPEPVPAAPAYEAPAYEAPAPEPVPAAPAYEAP